MTRRSRYVALSFLLLLSAGCREIFVIDQLGGEEDSGSGGASSAGSGGDGGNIAAGDGGGPSVSDAGVAGEQTEAGGSADSPVTEGASGEGGDSGRSVGGERSVPSSATAGESGEGGVVDGSEPTMGTETERPSAAGGATTPDGCDEGEVRCGNDCIDPNTDNGHCGASGSCEGEKAGQRCENDEVCNGAGKCGLACVGGTIKCDDECINPLMDRRFCGALNDCSEGTICSSGEICDDGRCEPFCADGLTLCGETCTNTTYDPNNCGACADEDGAVCGAGEACLDATCVPVVCVGDDCSVPPISEASCEDVLTITLNTEEPFSAQAGSLDCQVLDSGTGRMTYSLPVCGDGPYVACDFASGVNLNSFDADNLGRGVLEVEFCASAPVSGELNLWYGAFPTRKKIVLLAPGESMNAGCRTVRRAPEQAACHWTSRAAWAGDCGGGPAGGQDKSCAACGSTCNQGCPIGFSSTKITLIAEQCSVPTEQPVEIDLRAVRLLPPDCVCTSGAQCASSEERPDCENGLFSSKVCPVGAAFCGVCVPPEPTCLREGDDCIVQLSDRDCPGTVRCRGAVSTCEIADSACLEE